MRPCSSLAFSLLVSQSVPTANAEDPAPMWKNTRLPRHTRSRPVSLHVSTCLYTHVYTRVYTQAIHIPIRMSCTHTYTHVLYTCLHACLVHISVDMSARTSMRMSTRTPMHMSARHTWDPYPAPQRPPSRCTEKTDRRSVGMLLRARRARPVLARHGRRRGR